MLFGFLKPKPKYPASDRRKEPRYEAEDEFMLEFKAQQSHYIGAARDISVHGIRFATSCKPSIGREILLNLKFPQGFPGTKSLVIRAKVVRVYKPRGTGRYRVGCSLKHESEAGKETIRQLIHWIENRPEK